VLLVYCLLPGLVGVTRRFCGLFNAADVWSETVVRLVDRVARYDFDRRPQRIAANLLLDTLNGVCRWARVESRTTQRAAGLDSEDSADISPRIALAEAVARRVIDDLDAALIAASRVAGLPLRAAADLVGLSYEAAKKRRQRAEAALRIWWSESPEPDVALHAVA